MCYIVNITYDVGKYCGYTNAHDFDLQDDTVYNLNGVKNKTTLILPSLTQGAFIKAGFMQGGGWPLWGEPCTAGALFWREQQDDV